MDEDRESPLKELRTRLKLKQVDLADALDVLPSHLSKVEKGHAALGDKMKDTLRELGFDVETLDQRQEAFMETRRLTLRADLRAKASDPGEDDEALERQASTADSIA